MSEPKTQTVSFRVRGEIVEWLEVYAQKRSKTVSSVCEDIVIKKYMDSDLDVREHKRNR
jgi:hypothetical protein